MCVPVYILKYLFNFLNIFFNLWPGKILFLWWGQLIIKLEMED
jgi:hypothetical protein